METMPKKAGERLRVLVCEDDEAILDAVCLALQSSGYEAYPCADPAQAAAVARSANPHVILLDIWFKGKSSESLLRLFKLESSHSRIVLMSADSELPAFAARFGVDYLKKPFSLDELFGIVGNDSTN